MPDSSPRSRPVAYAVFLIIAGALGLLAAWELSVEKVLVLADPEHVPSCNVGVLVGCSVNLDSWQGSVFGFPNPFIGMMAWPVVITIGVAILAGAQFSRWFWIGLNVGVAWRSSSSAGSSRRASTCSACSARGACSRGR